MMSTNNPLDYLLAPTSAQAFVTEYWEQKPLLIQRHDPGYFQRYLTLADIDHLLANTDLHHPGFRLAKRMPLAHSVYTEERGFVGQTTHPNYIDLSKTFARFYDGASIVLQALHRNHKPVIDLCKGLERVLNYPIRANVYVTPANSQGFTRHYDDHDVLILQIDGCKRWKVYDTPIKLPLPSQPVVDSCGELLFDEVLEAGDCLYLPRGFPHDPLTENQHSVHITIGIYPITWYDVLAEWVKRALVTAQEHEDLRHSLPVGWLNEQALHSDTTQAILQQQLKTFIGEFDRHKAALADRIGLNFVQSLSTAGRTQLEDAILLHQLTPDTPIFRREEILYYFKKIDTKLRLSFHGKHLLFPEQFEPVLTHMLEQPAFTLQSLPAIEAAGKTVQDVVRQLIMEGFLTLLPRSNDGTLTS